MKWKRRHLPFDGRVAFRPVKWLQMFEDLLAAGANFARVPAMTEGQGILWSDQDEIMGVDAAWLENVQTVLDLAQSRHVKVELGLLPGNTPRKPGLNNIYDVTLKIVQDLNPSPEPVDELGRFQNYYLPNGRPKPEYNALFLSHSSAQGAVAP